MLIVHIQYKYLHYNLPGLLSITPFRVFDCRVSSLVKSELALLVLILRAIVGDVCPVTIALDVPIKSKITNNIIINIIFVVQQG